jgi:hypothetical protein
MANEVNPVFIPFVASATNPNPPAPLGAAEVAGLNQIGTALTNGPNAMLALNMARQRGNDLGENAVYDDWSQLDPIQFADKYGYDIYDQMSTLVRNQGELARLNNRDRDTTQILGDSANSIATGLVGGLGDITTLGAGLINDDAGRFVAGLTHDFREGMQGYQSTEENQRRFLNGIAAQLDEIDNTAAYEASIEEGNSELQATLGYLGRGFVNGVGRLFEDPLNLGTGVSEGIGSLLAGGYAGKGAKIGLAAMGRQFTREAVEDVVGEAVERTATQAAAATWGDEAVMSLVIGSMEGGNAYASTVNQIMEMSHEQLMAGSEEYRTLISAGMLPTQAKEELAAQAGVTAAMIAAPAGVLTGKLVSRFEAAPLARQTGQQMVGNLGREAIEEGAQSVTGQLGTNVGLSMADNSIQPLEGAGEGAGEGAVLGSMTAGAVQSPRAAGRVAVAGATAAIDKVVSRGERVAATVEAANAVDEPAIRANISGQAQAVEEALLDLSGASDVVTNQEVDQSDDETVEGQVDANEAVATEKIREVKDIIQNIFGTPESLEAEFERMSPELSGRLKGTAETRFDLMHDLVKMTEDTDVSEEGRQEAALRAKVIMDEMQGMFDTEIPAAVANVPEENRSTQALQALTQEYNTLRNLPVYKQMLAKAEGKLADPTTDSGVMAVVDARPADANEAGIQKILMQDNVDGKPLSQRDRSKLNSIMAMIKAGRELAAKSESIAATEDIPAVAKLADASAAVAAQIGQTGGQNFAGQKSLAQYVQGITSDMSKRRDKSARFAMSNLRNFAQNQINKYRAWEESMRTGKPVSYARTGKNGTELSDGVVNFQKDAPAAYATARQIHAEMTALVDMHKALSEQYPSIADAETQWDDVPSLAPEFADKGKPAEKPVEKPSTESRVTLEAAIETFRKYTPEQIKARISEIKDRLVEGKGTPSDPATLDVLYRAAKTILDESTAAVRKQTKADKVAAITQPQIDAVVDVLVEKMDEKNRLLVADLTPEQKFILKEKLKAKITSKYATIVNAKMVAKLLALRTERAGKPPNTPPQDDQDDFDEVATPEIIDLSTVPPAERAKTRFPLLVQVKNKVGRVLNYFHEAWSFPTKPTSRFQTTPGFLKVLKADIRADESLEKKYGTMNFNESNQKVRNNLRQMVSVAERLSKIVRERLSKHNSDGRLERYLNEGYDFQKRQNGRALALVETKADGKLGYNDDLLDAASMAAVQWRLNSGYMTSGFDTEQISKLLKITEEEAEEFLPFFQSGMMLDIAVKSLADTIIQFWGVVPSRKMGAGIVQGMAEAVAKEMITAMEYESGNPNAGITIKGTSAVLVESLDMKTFDETRTDKYTMVRFVNDKNSAAPFGYITTKMTSESDFLADVTLIGDWEKGISLGEPSKVLKRTQLRNPLVNNTDKQNRAIRRMSDTVQIVNMNMLNFAKAVGEIEMRVFRGGSDLTPITNYDFDPVTGEEIETTKPITMNNQHRKTVDGKNNTYRTSYEDVMRLANMVEGYAEKHGVDMSAVPVFFSWAVNRIDRFQMAGRSNPESDKLMREVVTAIKSVLDMTDTKGEYLFWKGIAQGIGLKTHKVKGDKSMVEAMELTSNPKGLGRIVEQMEKWLEDPSNSMVSPKSMMQDIKAQMGAKATLHAVTSLMEVAKLNVARRTGADLSKFETFAYLEADGITNGPIMALLKMASGLFNARWVEQVARGGLFFGSKQMSLNDYYANEANVDIYTNISKKLSEKIALMQSIMTPEVKKQSDRLDRLMGALGVIVDVNPTTGNVTVSRDGVKNPVTVTIYASGVDGITDKVTAIVVKALYARVSELAEEAGQAGPNDSISKLTDGLSFRGQPYTMEQMKDDFHGLTRINALTTDTGGIVLSIPKNMNMKDEIVPKQDYVSFKLSKEQMLNFRTNMGAYITGPMYETINAELLSHVSGVTKPLQNVTQGQSIIVSFLFKKFWIDRVRYKRDNPELFPEWDQSDNLSAEEAQAIWKEVYRYAPVVETTDQNYLVSKSTARKDMQRKERQPDGSSKNVGAPLSYGGDLLTSRMRNGVSVQAPTEVGVAATPYTTIGTGEALSMTNLFGGLPKDSVPRMLSVYDGLNLALDIMESMSERMNESVFEAWTDNAVKAIADNANAFMKTDYANLLKDMDFETKAALRRLILPEDTTTRFSNSEIIKMTEAFMKQQTALLNARAEEVEIRQQVLKEAPIWVDQMAGGERPYHNKGSKEGQFAFKDINGQSSPEAISKALNVLYGMVKARRAKEARKSVSDLEKNRSKLMSLLQEEANQVKELKHPSGVIVLTTRHMVSVLKGKLPTEHWNALRLAVDGDRYVGQTQVVLGTPEQVLEYQRQVNPAILDQIKGEYKGLYDPNTNVIYVRDVNSETLAHEVLHALTTRKFATYYGDPENKQKRLRPYEVDSIKRIESLMVDFLAGDGIRFQNQQARDQQTAYRLISNKIGQMLVEGDKVGALGEFVSYTMTNRQLVKLMKKSKTQNFFVKITLETLQALKTLIWGNTAANDKRFDQEIGDSFYDNMLFNLQILSENSGLVFEAVMNYSDMIMYQTEQSDDTRITLLRQKLAMAYETLAPHARRTFDTAEEAATNIANVVESDTRAKQDYFDAMDTGKHLIASGFNMNQAQMGLFSGIVSAMYSDMKLNRNALSRMQDVYDFTISKLTYKDFMENPGHADGSEGSIQDQRQAKMKYDALSGKLGSNVKRDGQSDLLASVVGLAAVNPEFRAILSKIQYKKNARDAAEGVDDAVDNFFLKAVDSAMDNLSKMVSRSRDGRTVLSMLDNLTNSMLNHSLDHETAVELKAQNVVRKVENKINDVIQSRSEKLGEKAVALSKTTNSKLVKIGAQLVNLATSAVNEEATTAGINRLSAILNGSDGKRVLREFVNEIKQHDDDNTEALTRINIVRGTIDRMRQQFREELPKNLRKKFKKGVQPEQWKAMKSVFQRTDLTTLMNAFGLEQALSYVVSKKKRDAKIEALVAQIKDLDPNFGELVIKKSDQLAVYNTTGVSGPNLLTNAEKIAGLFSEVSMNHPKRRGVKRGELQVAVDQYVTLKILSLVPDSEMKMVNDLINDEPVGVQYLMDTLAGIRNDELEKLTESRGRINHFKGYIKPQNQENEDLIVAPVSRQAELVLQGYVWLEDYKGSNLDYDKGKMAYYMSPMSGSNRFHQGIIQNTQKTYSGVNEATGLSIDRTAGVITGRAAQQIAAQSRKDTGGAEALRPIHDENGEVVAYERMLDPLQLARLKSNNNLAELMGAWKGRQMEELIVDVVNEDSIATLKAMWDKARGTADEGQFFNLSTLTREEDPVLYEAYGLLPDRVKDQIAKEFGANGFMVKRDLENQSVGIRAAGASDFFTGNSRLTPDQQKKMRNMILGLFAFGKPEKAFVNAMNAEAFWKGAVLDAKQMIVIKSVVVPAANLFSNAGHLLNLGISFRKIFLGLPQKAVETHDYMRRRKLEIQLNSDLLGARGRKDQDEINRLNNRLQSIRDSYKKMSIWPMIEAEEFSAISVGGFSQESNELSDGKFNSLTETFEDKIPKKLKVFYRYGMLTHDTPLFAGLSLMTQYGDFLAKSILYDHLTEVKGFTKTKALREVSEEFVNYNYFPGRTRAAAESMGLQWFYSYKIRSTKVALRTMQRHPLRTLLMTAVTPKFPIVGTIGSPVWDSLLGAILDGSWLRGIGPGQLLDAPQLNPWYQLVDWLWE